MDRLRAEGAQNSYPRSLRSGMYIDDTRDGSGLHHMVYEVVGNAINEGSMPGRTNGPIDKNCGEGRYRP